MVPYLVKLRKVLPRRAGDALWQAYWRWFWQREQRQEERELGKPASSPIAGSERAVLAECIAAKYPFDSLLDVGCGYGQNFFTIAPQYPHVRFLGIDTDASRIQAGRELLQRRTISHVELSEADARNLSVFPDKCFDVVVSAAFLLLITPEEIEHVIREMLRLAKKSVLLLEQHDEAAEGPMAALGTFVLRSGGDQGYWVRNYRTLLESIVAAADIRIRPIPRPRWELELWKSLAHVIEVKPPGS